MNPAALVYAAMFLDAGLMDH